MCIRDRSDARRAGAVDARAEQEYGFELQALASQIPSSQRALALSAASPWRYPRNRAGRGYLVEDHPASYERLELPNLEDPRDLLTPERLVVGDPDHWPLQPLPASFTWIEHGAFPRLGWFGETPPWDAEEIERYVTMFPEVRFGYATPELFRQEGSIEQRFDRRALNGASLSLRFPKLRGNERFILIHLHPRRPAWSFRLPGERPKLFVDDRAGGLTEVAAHVASVSIEPDLDRVSVVWSGFTRARRVYPDSELAQMPFQVRW
nr:MAG: hypothetical protein DIU78_12420 [Pseudomonadota bacterium]